MAAVWPAYSSRSLFPLINTGGSVESAGQALSAEGIYQHAEVVGRRRWRAARSLYQTAKANARAAAQAVRWAHETLTLTQAASAGRGPALWRSPRPRWPVFKP